VASGRWLGSKVRNHDANPHPPLLTLPALKLSGRIADNSFVHRFVIIAGLTLAWSAATLAGTGEWAADEASDSVGPSASPPVAASGQNATSHELALAPMPMNLLPAGSYSPAGIPGYTVSRTVPEVRLEFTVADEQGRLMPHLAAKDIRVLDNHVPVEHFSDFAREENLPLRLGIVLDTSDSVKRVLPDEKAAALSFLDRILRPQSDRAFVMAFGGEVRIWQAFTADRARLTDAVRRLHQPGWGTSLYDALYAACNEYPPYGDESSLVHRAIVVLSDGDDNQSFHDLRDVVAIAQRGEVQIYALALRGRKQVSRSDAVLQRLAEQTGGRFYVAPSSRDLEGSFGQIEQELRTQYYVSFPPQQVTPGFHALQVQVRTPQRTQIHARQGYYAAAQ
jgi:VWFA-related protein